MSRPCAARTCGHSGGRVQLVYQNPFSSLDPRQSVEQIVAEPLHNFGDGTARRAPGARRGAHRPRRAARGPARSARRASCRAASASASRSPGRSPSDPEIVVLDEAVSALDVTVQARILELLESLQQELGLTLSVHLARPRGGAADQPHRVGDAARPRRRSRRRSKTSSPAPNTTTRASCSQPCPDERRRSHDRAHPRVLHPTARRRTRARSAIASPPDQIRHAERFGVGPRLGRAAPLPRRRGRAAVAVRLPRPRAAATSEIRLGDRRRHAAARGPGARGRGRRRRRPALGRPRRPRARQRRHARRRSSRSASASTTKARSTTRSCRPC